MSADKRKPDRFSELWRVGSNIPINVYEGDRPVCQCHTLEDAKRIVAAINWHLGIQTLEAAREVGKRAGRK